MKNKFLVVVAIVATVMFTSCKPKLSEETKKGIAEFKTEWTTMSGSLAAWGDSLNANMGRENDAHKMMGETMGDTSKMKKEAKAKMKESMAMCQANVEKLNAMKKTFSDYKTGVDTSTTAFTDWSAKVDKGEVTEEQAKTAMEGYHKSLDDANAKMKEWDGAMKGIMADEMKNHQECMEACMPAKKDDKGAKGAKGAAPAKGGAAPAPAKKK